MIKSPVTLQDLRKRIYLKAKAEPAWRFWGLYVHVCKMETLQEAYRMAKANNGAPGIDGVTFEAIEKEGLEQFLESICEELVTETYLPQRNRQKEIPKGRGENPNYRDTDHPGSSGTGCAEADSGADLRSGFSGGIVWLPTETNATPSGATRC